MSYKSLTFYLLLFLVIGVLTVACDSRPPQPLSVKYYEGVVADGQFEHSENVGLVGPAKGLQIEILQDNFTVKGETVRVAFNFNSRTEDAMLNANTMVAISGPPVNSATPTFFVDVPESSALQPCDWIHYRWSFQYERPDQASPGTFVGGVRALQLTESLVPYDEEGGGVAFLTKSHDCDDIP